MHIPKDEKCLTAQEYSAVVAEASIEGGLAGMAVGASLALVIMPPQKPFVGAAFLCEHVLEEKDGVLSAVRIVDTVYVESLPELPKGEKPGFKLTLLVILKAGPIRGEFAIRISVRNPEGKSIKMYEQSKVLLKGDQHGANVVLQTIMPVSKPGLFWFDVEFEGEVVTSVPLRILEAKSGESGAIDTRSNQSEQAEKAAPEGL